MTNESINPNAEFMTRIILDDETVIDEFSLVDNKIKTLLVTDMVKTKGIKKIGLVGKNQFINLDTDTKIFNLIGKQINVSLIKDNKEILNTNKRADRLITFITNEQQLVKNKILNDLPIRYTFGYKIDNENVFAKIKMALDKHRGILLLNDITARDNFTATFNIYVDEKIIASKTIQFEKNKTISIDVNLN